MRDAANIRRDRVHLDRSSLHTIRRRESRRNTVAKKSLREQLIGAWKLLSYIETPVDGSPKRFPMGENAQGIIMYTPDGYMALDAARANALTGTWG